MKKLLTLCCALSFVWSASADMYLRGDMSNPSWSVDATCQMTQNTTYGFFHLAKPVTAGYKWWKGSDGTASSYIGSARKMEFAAQTYDFYARTQGADVVCSASDFYLVGDNFGWTVSAANKMTLQGTTLTITKNMGTTPVGNYKIVDVDEYGAIAWGSLMDASAAANTSSLTGAVTISFDFATWSFAATQAVTPTVTMSVDKISAEQGQTINFTAETVNVTSPSFVWQMATSATGTYTSFGGSLASQAYVCATSGTLYVKVDVYQGTTLVLTSDVKTITISGTRTPAVVGLLTATSSWDIMSITSTNKFVTSDNLTWTLTTTTSAETSRVFKLLSAETTYAWANDITAYITTFDGVERLGDGNLSPTITLVTGEQIELTLVRTSINSDVYALTLQGRGLPDALTDVDRKAVRIYTTADALCVVTNEESTIEVYTVAGVLIDQTVTNFYNKVVPIGAYLIRVNGITYKVMK